MAKKKKKKFYVVWHGHEPGIYETWAECQRQTSGFPQAKYKSFTTRAEALMAYADLPENHIGQGPQKSTAIKDYRYIDEVDQYALAVDAACSSNPGPMEYQGVWVANSDPLFRQGPFAMGTNNVGEFLAIVHALAYFEKTGESDVTIYTDSRIAMSWIKAKNAKTKLKRTAQNAKLFELIARAEKWLQSHTFENPILKWKTKEWGEIPADFGRK